MVGLSIVLEPRNCSDFANKKASQVINKADLMVNKPPVSPSSTSLASFRVPAFLEHCSLCRGELSPGKDIYMYKGDRAFCSEECRWRQILLDEEELLMRDNCSLAAKTASSHGSRRRKSSRGRFVY